MKLYLYELLASFILGNHSCAPNAEVTFPHNNSTLVLVAIRDIEQDEVGFIND